MNLDITERKEAERQRDLLRHELNHRVKNTLATVMSIALQTLNAAKHGALSVSTGRVDLAWRVRSLNGTRDLHLTWAETGGPPVQAPARKGFGSRLIEEGPAHELDGTVRLDFDVGGVKCAIVAPLPPTESQP